MPKTVAGWRIAWSLRACPYWIALSFPLGLWLGNLGEEPAALDVLASFLLPLLAVALADRLVGRRLGDTHVRPLVLSLLVVGLLGYGHVFAAVNRAIHLRQPAFALGWLLVMGVAVAALLRLRSSRHMERASRFLQRTSPLLVAVQLVWACPLVAPHAGGMSQSRALPASPAAVQPNTSHPDIYYIILDGYARQDKLKELYGFDNSEFLDALTRRGFYIASQARSNYAQTRLSLSSSLSMDYLPQRQQGESEASYLERIRQLRKHSRVVARVRQAGYRYRYVGSIYFPLDATADQQLSPPPARRTWLRAFLATTLLEPTLQLAGGDRLVQDPVAVQEYQFQNIARPKDNPAPLFTFAHIACPHEPYLFDHRGPLPRPVPASEATARDYVEQLRYLNAQVIGLLDAIDRTSGRDAVVLLQADHGTALLGMPAQPGPQQLAERMAILSAFRVPDRVRQKLYPTMTPVNSFQLVFNGLLGDNEPLLADRSLYSAYDSPLEFVAAP